MVTSLDRIFGFTYDKEEWYFTAREGIKGPYPSREDAAWALITFVNQCIEHNLKGGRSHLLDSSRLAEVVIDPPHWTNT